MYGEISIGVTIRLVFASVGVKGCQISGTKMTSAKIPAWRPMETTCVQPKVSSFDQISLTFTGRIPGGRGGCFVGEKNSVMRYKNPPKLAPQFTASRLLIGPFGTGRELKNSFRFSPTPLPKELRVNGAPGRSTTLTGRSVRNCLRLDQKSSETKFAGAPKRGTALAGTGTFCCGLDPAGALLFTFAGKRLMNGESGTFVP